MRFSYYIHGMELLEAMTAGWRYLFSRSYRFKKQKEWRGSGWLSVTLEVIYGLLGILLSLVVIGFAGFAMWNSQSH